MSCDICGKTGGHDLHCVTCARSYLEQPRIDLIKALIDGEQVAKHVTAAIQGSEDKDTQHVSLVDSKGGLLVDRQECTNNIELQRTRAEISEINERMSTIGEQVDLLKSQMEDTRQRVEALRARNAQRKSDMSSATYGVDSRRANELNKVQQIIKKTDYESNKTHQDTVEIRNYLCGTAARLAGLKVTRRRVKEDGSIKEIYCIGPGTRIKIYDLRDLNGGLIYTHGLQCWLTYSKMHPPIKYPPRWLQLLSLWCELQPTSAYAYQQRLLCHTTTTHSLQFSALRRRIKAKSFPSQGLPRPIPRRTAQKHPVHWIRACMSQNRGRYTLIDR